MIGIRKVKGNSMHPTIRAGDFLIIQKIFFKPKIGDIVTAITQDGEVLKRIKKIEGKEYYIKGDNPASSSYKVKRKMITGKVFHLTKA